MSSTSDRLSIPIMTGFETGEEFNVSMFTEDLYQDIVPIRARDYPHACRLEPKDKSAEQQLVALFSAFNRLSSKSLTDMIFEAIRHIGGSLVTAGSIALELVKLTNADDDEVRTDHKLMYISGDKVIRDGHIVQRLTPEEAAQWDTAQEIKIPLEKCWIIDFPDNLGGKKGYLKFLQEMKELGNSDPFRIFLDNELRGLKGYDIAKHHKIADLSLWEQTKEFGWHHRETSGKMFSGYYMINRRLRFRKTQFILRDHIIAELIKYVDQFLSSDDRTFALSIDHIGTTESVSQAIDDWAAGKLQQEELTAVLMYP
ncbi:hypothetical protein [Mucilaginibacter phyllosphaerae]